MKGLTVRQPWAWAIAAGDKTVENRGRGAQHWQPQINVAIHAGKAWSHRGAGEWLIWGALGRSTVLPDDDEFVRSAIIAVVDVLDVHPWSDCCKPWGEKTYRHADGSMVQTVTHLVLDNVRRLERPVLFTRGQLGLWTVPPDVEQTVRRSLTAA